MFLTGVWDAQWKQGKGMKRLCPFDRLQAEASPTCISLQSRISPPIQAPRLVTCFVIKGMLAVAPEIPPSLETSLTEQRWWNRHGYILPVFLLTMAICAWFVTWGDWNLFDREHFCGFYDAQARSLIAGRLDVPQAAIGTESFTFHGRTYGYFGIGPALLRVPLVLLFKNMDGRWSRVMMFIACSLNLICAYGLLTLVRREQVANWRKRRVLHSLFILCAGIGSTNVFLVARSFTFHEAIMWGGTFALLFTWTILSYLARPSKTLLVLASSFAFMSLHSRATVGVGPLLVMIVVAGALIWRIFGNPKALQSMFGFATSPDARSHAIIASASVIIILVSYFGVNYAKFHTFDGVPLKYYDIFAQNAAFRQVSGGRPLHLENVPTTLVSYLGFHGLWLAQFPWIYPSREATFVGSPAIIFVDGFSTFPVSMPALLVLAGLGGLPLVRGGSETARRLRLPAIALLCGGAIVLTALVLTERYLHDFYPALIICGAVGVSRIEQEKYPRAATALIAVLATVSIAVNCSLALENQRLDTWNVGGVPAAKKAEFKRFQRSIYLWFHSPRQIKN